KHLQQPRYISAALKNQCFLRARYRFGCSSGGAKTCGAYLVQCTGRNTIARRLFAAPAPVRWTLERSLATPPTPSNRRRRRPRHPIYSGGRSGTFPAY
uniref:Uncharacterized protein n=1 Tax=Triticum urartu TaxID=4572 RepID=A0A8R7TQX6_TRIUA